ncbi:acyl-CoA dehydrogenase family protein, partial [Halieaceae bacterium]|nr:acyl-CoA dehydrogenase family protein [Halieaceae bacterium]
ISGESEFCQTFFDNVKVPKENLVGELNKGWSVAKALLKHERKLMSELGSENPRPNYMPADAARQYKKFENGKLADSRLRTELVNYDMDAHAIGITHQRIFEERRLGVQNSLPLIMKFVGTELEKRRSELNMALMGSQGMSFEGDTFTDLEKFSTLAWAMSKTTTIAGGSSEVQLNIISKRVLGLPQS